MKDSFDKAHVVFFAIVVLATVAFYSAMYAISTALRSEHNNNVEGINAVVVVAAYALFRYWNNRDEHPSSRRY